MSTVIALVYIEKRQSARCSFAPGAPKEQIQFEQTVGYSAEDMQHSKSSAMRRKKWCSGETEMNCGTQRKLDIFRVEI